MTMQNMTPYELKLEFFRMRLMTLINDKSGRRPSVLNADTIAAALRLCYLQLAQALPISVHLVVYSLDTFSRGGNLIQSMDDIEQAYSSFQVYCASYVTDIIAHYFHLFAYLAFSKLFRDEFIKIFFRKSC